MKRFRLMPTLAVLVSSLLLIGCASTPPLTVTEPVGPTSRTAADRERRGTLVVYSDWDLFAPGDADRHYRQDYTLIWPGGTRTERVRNHLGWLDEGPVPVRLPPGTYCVKAWAARQGPVVLTVVIKADRATMVRLDGANPNLTDVADASVVRLPNGQVVGSKAAR